MLSSDSSIKVVVTGASGFIGRRVISFLQRKPGLELIPVTRQQIKNWICVTDYANSPVGDVLIHLAENSNRSQVSVLDNLYEQKVTSTLSILLSKGYSKVIYVSSALLYGDQDNHAHLTTDPVAVTDTYTRIKYWSEKAVLNISGGMVIRPANVYGYGMSKTSVMSDILRQIPGDGELSVVDTSPICDFINVDDVAEGIVALCLGHIINNHESRIYNLGTGIGTSVGDLACMALDITGQSYRKVAAKISPVKSSNLVLDCSKTTLHFGWRPKIILRHGLCNLLSRGSRRDYEKT